MHSSEIFVYNLDHLNVTLNQYNQCHLNAIYSDDCDEAIKRLKPKESAGCDIIPPYILKEYQEWLKMPLLHIFNLITRDSL